MTLAIFDVDELYAERLTDYIRKRSEVPLEVTLFTEEEALIQFTQSHEIDLLLIHIHLMNPILKEQRIGEVIYLTDVETKADTKARFWYKFQSAQPLLDDILACYQVREPTLGGALTIHNAEVIGIYPVEANMQATLFSLLLNRVLAEDNRVLYLTLEQLSGLSKLLDMEFQYDLSDAVYYDEQQQLIEKLSDLAISTDNYTLIPPMRNPLDCSSVLNRQIEDMVRTLSTCGGYDFIVVNLGADLLRALAMIPCCHRVYMPITDDVVSQAKQVDFQKAVYEMEQENLLKKIHSLTLPALHQAVQAPLQVNTYLYGEWGDFIRRRCL